MKFIIGKKIDMTQVWKGERAYAVTRVQAGPCTVLQIKSVKKDGYDAMQLGFGSRKEKNIAKPQKGHMRDLGFFRFVREFRYDPKQEKNAPMKEIERGDKIDTSAFEAGDIVKVIGTSKGKGFQGVVKRHGFHGQDKTHGNKDQVRMPGSIGSTGPQHVFKGMRMAGRMGGEQTTVSNLEIIEIDNEQGIISIKGAVPGARNSLVLIEAEGVLKKTQAAAAPAETEPEGTIDETAARASESQETAEAAIEKPAEEEQNV